LNSQAQAHLLANVLSLISALSRRRPEAAEDLLAYVAAYLRMHLMPVRPLVCLSDEIRMVLTFVGVERARLGGRLRLEIACAPEALAALVPPLALQSLVENAIRHGIARRAGGGCVRLLARVSGDRLHIAVTDDGPGVRRPVSPGGPTGWGLTGLRLRLEALWGSSARLRLLARPGAGTLAALSLPVIPTPGRQGEAS
jgi:two-component system LytT family sensor kinase